MSSGPVTVTDIGVRSNATGATITISTTVPTGATVIVIVFDRNTVGTVPNAPTDAHPNTYTLISSAKPNNIASGGILAMFYAKNVAGFTGNLSWTPIGTSGGFISAFYYNGLTSADSLDSATLSTVFGSSQTPSATLAASPASANSLAVGVVATQSGTITMTQDTTNASWATPPDPASSPSRLFGGNVLTSTAVTYAPGMSISANWCEIIVAFKPPTQSGSVNAMTQVESVGRQFSTGKAFLVGAGGTAALLYQATPFLAVVSASAANAAKQVGQTAWLVTDAAVQLLLKTVYLLRGISVTASYSVVLVRSRGSAPQSAHGMLVSMYKTVFLPAVGIIQVSGASLHLTTSKLLSLVFAMTTSGSAIKANTFDPQRVQSSSVVHLVTGPVAKAFSVASSELVALVRQAVKVVQTALAGSAVETSASHRSWRALVTTAQVVKGLPGLWHNKLVQESHGLSAGIAANPVKLLGLAATSVAAVSRSAGKLFAAGAALLASCARGAYKLASPVLASAVSAARSGVIFPNVAAGEAAQVVPVRNRLVTATSSAVVVCQRAIGKGLQVVSGDLVSRVAGRAKTLLLSTTHGVVAMLGKVVSALRSTAQGQTASTVRGRVLAITASGAQSALVAFGTFGRNLHARSAQAGGVALTLLRATVYSVTSGSRLLLLRLTTKSPAVSEGQASSLSVAQRLLRVFGVGSAQAWLVRRAQAVAATTPGFNAPASLVRATSKHITLIGASAASLARSWAKLRLAVSVYQLSGAISQRLSAIVRIGVSGLGSAARALVSYVQYVIPGSNTSRTGGFLSPLPMLTRLWNKAVGSDRKPDKPQL